MSGGLLGVMGRLRTRYLAARLSAAAARVDAPGAAASNGQKQKDKAVEDCLLPAVERRAEEVTLRCMCHEVRHRHFSGEDECHWPGEKAKQQQQTSHNFEHSGKTDE